MMIALLEMAQSAMPQKIQKQAQTQKQGPEEFSFQHSTTISL